jgi:hypothetical protein
VQAEDLGFMLFFRHFEDFLYIPAVRVTIRHRDSRHNNNYLLEADWLVFQTDRRPSNASKSNKETTNKNMNRAYKVNNVHIHLVNSKPTSLIICVIGSVTSSGWSHAELSPWVYISPPADGIYDFDFLATPPTGIALDVITPIAVATAFPKPPVGLKGVRIHASANSLEGLITGNSYLEFPDADVKLLGGDYWPW